jgi:hypothetical protein
MSEELGDPSITAALVALQKPAAAAIDQGAKRTRAACVALPSPAQRLPTPDTVISTGPDTSVTIKTEPRSQDTPASKRYQLPRPNVVGGVGGYVTMDAYDSAEGYYRVWLYYNPITGPREEVPVCNTRDYHEASNAFRLARSFAAAINLERGITVHLQGLPGWPMGGI